MNKTKEEIVFFFPILEKENVQEKWVSDLRESLSLNFLAFRPSVLFGPRSKVVLRGKATRGHQFFGVSTTPRGRDLFLLDLFFG